MTRQEIKNNSVESPIVFRDDEHLECYIRGLQDGVDVAERELIDNACKIFKDYLNNTYQIPSFGLVCLTPNEKEIMKMHTIDALVFRFRMTLMHMQPVDNLNTKQQ
jgi:hypothetical protein